MRPASWTPSATGQAIESFSNSQIALPDMHYQVIDFDGNPSDVVSVTPDANNSGLAT